MDALNLEKIQVLAGERGDRGKAAVRRADFDTGKALQSKQITTAPTQADFNAIQADVATLWNLLDGIRRKT